MNAAKNDPADLFKDDAGDKTNAAAERSEQQASTTPAADDKKAEAAKPATNRRSGRAVPETIDHAVDVTQIHWECGCGNTNTLDLTRCGACNEPRFTTG